MIDFMEVVGESRRFEASQRSRSVKYFIDYFDNEQQQDSFERRNKVRLSAQQKIEQGKSPDMNALYNSNRDQGKNLDPEHSRFTTSARGDDENQGADSMMKGQSFSRQANQEAFVEDLQSYHDDLIDEATSQYDEFAGLGSFHQGEMNNDLANNPMNIYSRVGSVISNQSREDFSQMPLKKSRPSDSNFLQFGKNNKLDESVESGYRI